MVKIISSKRMLVIGIAGVCAFLLLMLIGVYISIFKGYNMFVIGVLGITFGFLGLCAFLIFTNRMACWICFDENYINRKGFFCGFKYKLNTNEITNVISYTFLREFNYIVIIDNYQKKYEGFSKRSFIQFEKNKKNLIILNQYIKMEFKYDTKA